MTTLLDNKTIYDDLISQLAGKSSKLVTSVDIIGQDPVSPSPHRIGDACAVSLAALGSEMATIWKRRTGIDETVKVSVDAAIHQLMAVFLTTRNGYTAHRLLEDPKLLQLSGFYKARNGRYVYLLNSYPHLRDINCDVLNTPFSRQKMCDAVARWDAFHLEEEICSRGGTCIVVRSREEWEGSPQGSLLLNTPVIDIEYLADSPPEPMPKIENPALGLPLAGFKILDNTHVIAGPMCSRILAEHGAEVLSMFSPDHMDPAAMTMETGIGKRSAFCDLDNPEDRTKFFETLRGADAYVTSYLSLDKKGYGPLRLIQHRPGLVFCEFHGWGKDGPWHQRGGFDQLACSATGFAMEEGSPDGPSLPPTYLLNDYLAAILGAAGMAEAFRKRETDGGSYRVHVNLSRVAMWVQSLGLFKQSDLLGLTMPKADVHGKQRLNEVTGSNGLTRYLPTQIGYCTGSIKPALTKGCEPTGASELCWT